MLLSNEKLQQILAERKDIHFADLYNEYGVGSQCASCEWEVKALLDDHRAELGLQWETDGTPRREQFKRRSWLDLFREPFEPLKANYRTGLFAMRKGEFETKIVISNLGFPENHFNPNGHRVRFQVLLDGEHGERLGASKILSLSSNHSGEYSLSHLFPSVRGDVIGAFYIDFFNLRMTNSLRPYGLLESDGKGGGAARCHYHDKYALFMDPGYFQTQWAFTAGQTCWMAVCNCQDIPYESAYFLRNSERLLSGHFSLPPKHSRWIRVSDLFSHEPFDPVEFRESLFYFENPQHVMMWFFWHAESANCWVGQHH
jgi:bacterioferritin-associated ferredoxin